MSPTLSFRDYQREAATTDLAAGQDLKAIMVPLLGLAGEAGSLLSEYKKFLREGERYKPFTDQVSEEIGDILWYLANIAQKAGLDLQEIAEENLGKLRQRWPQDGDGAGLFPLHSRYDAAYPDGERLPTTIRVEFRDVLVNGVTKLQMTCDGRVLGDPLTDNSHVEDGYRYHDVFHLTNATLLGWSPVVRSKSLLYVKRKSNLPLEEVEDGARAAVTEEAISALVFAHAKDYSFFEGATSVDYEVLRSIALMTRPFEVRDRSPRDWERAILQGYAVWRQMIANRGGVFVGDAVAHSVSYEPLPTAPSSTPLEPSSDEGPPSLPV